MADEFVLRSAADDELLDCAMEPMEDELMYLKEEQSFA